ncbi:MAG TPA: DNA polymerase III subunit beta [Cyanobacteria bacterium UBA11369]|nr:DNA polymerase III subunit beta [Cyanobacteria bacterium UBA11371]HBE34989.1 DNA polymerase III subunit beta [Cyanobacteria bacterium UBA11368]HBE49045.1 DNA polymerase III subunit beta [Cyanobacteria bacterium UBA11369]
MQTKTRPGTRKSQVKENGSSKTKTKADATAARTKSLTAKKPKVEKKPESLVERSTEESTPLLSTGMRLICTQDNLANHLDLVSHAVPSKPTHPVLGNVLLIAEQETQKVQLSVFDMSLGIQTSFDAKVQAPGELTIPVGLLSDIVGKLSAGDITLVNHTPLNTEDTKDNSQEKAEAGQNPVATLIATTGRYQVRGLPTEEFPAIPEVNSTQTIHVPVEGLKAGLKGTLFATTTDETKRILTGVHLKIHGDTLEFAATDGHRLAVISTALQGFKKNQRSEIEETLELTVPAKALVELDRILSSRTSVEPVQLSYDESQAIVEFRWGAQRLVSRCLSGAYPAYEELLKQDFKQQITLEKAPLIKALERIAVLADKKEKTVSIRLNSEAQQVSLSLFREFGNGKEEMTACINSDSDMSISFNIKYFLEGVKAIASSAIQMQLTQQDGPAILVPFGNKDKPNILMDAKYLLMPIFKE